VEQQQVIRQACLDDLKGLVALEQRCFDSDRISARQFRYLLTKAHALTLVDERGDGIVGDVVVLFRRGTSLARLYSIAVDGAARGRGVGGALLDAAGNAAREHGCAYMRAEIRTDNAPSLALFASRDYRQFGVLEDYYEDHADAVRLEKRLVQRHEFRGVQVPYYQQTLDFSCGSAAVMMAMKAVDSGFVLDRRTEVRLWREATTVFMTSGHGGCGPYGLALAAHHRGFDVSVYVSDASGLFVDSVRSDEKKAVIRLVEEDFLEEIERAGIPLHHERLTADTLGAAVHAGRVPVVLISSYRMYQEKFPHWVVVTGADESFFYIHDPFVDEEKGKTATDCVDIPVTRAEFERMARYGKAAQQAAVIVGRRRHGNRRKG
jgi:ribosomal protein S18 acetylase RimI-like enzyme